MVHRTISFAFANRSSPLSIRQLPCNLELAGAVVDGSPQFLRSSETVGKRGTSSIVPLNPDSRLGRSQRSSFAQGWVKMGTYVGIDVSKDRLDIHVLPQDEAFCVERNGKGLALLVERLKPLAPDLMAIEATGGFESTVAAAVAGSGLPLAVVNPAQVRHYAQALGKRAKTDAIDVKVIARFAADVKPDARALLGEAAQLLADLVTRRRQIVEMLQAERQRQMRVTIRRRRKSIERLIVALEKELAALDHDIGTAVRSSGMAGKGRPAGLCSRRRSPDCPYADRRIA